MSGLAQFVAARGLGTLLEWSEEGYNAVSKIDQELSGESMFRWRYNILHDLSWVYWQGIAPGFSHAPFGCVVHVAYDVIWQLNWITAEHCWGDFFYWSGLDFPLSKRKNYTAAVDPLIATSQRDKYKHCLQLIHYALMRKIDVTWQFHNIAVAFPIDFFLYP